MFHSGYTDKEINQWLLKVIGWTFVALVIAFGLMVQPWLIPFFAVSGVLLIIGKLRQKKKD